MFSPVSLTPLIGSAAQSNKSKPIASAHQDTMGHIPSICLRCRWLIDLSRSIGTSSLEALLGKYICCFPRSTNHYRKRKIQICKIEFLPLSRHTRNMRAKIHFSSHPYQYLDPAKRISRSDWFQHSRLVKRRHALSVVDRWRDDRNSWCAYRERGKVMSRGEKVLISMVIIISSGTITVGARRLFADGCWTVTYRSNAISIIFFKQKLGTLF